MSKTQENLLKAFAGESMARNKYTIFAEKAREDGYESIARVFELTADNERGHAERLMSLVKPDTKVQSDLGLDPAGDTYENLTQAADGEKYEWGSLYPEFEATAKEEGENEISATFKEIGEVEEKHEQRYRKLADRVKAGTIYKREQQIEWECSNCGYVHTGTEAPGKCPACAHPQEFYKPRNEKDQ